MGGGGYGGVFVSTGELQGQSPGGVFIGGGSTARGECLPRDDKIREESSLVGQHTGMQRLISFSRLKRCCTWRTAELWRLI